METVVNYWAILVGAIVVNFIGMLWYGPLFGKTWMKLSGISAKKMDECKKKGMAKTIAANFVITLVIAYVTSMFVNLMGATSAVGGAITGFWIWLGFVATIMLNSVFWEGQPMKLYVLKAMHELVTFVVLGAILAVW